MFVRDIANYSPFAVKVKLIVERASEWVGPRSRGSQRKGAPAA